MKNQLVESLSHKASAKLKHLYYHFFSYTTVRQVRIDNIILAIICRTLQTIILIYII
jgi:hypothetical protein